MRALQRDVLDFFQNPEARREPTGLYRRLLDRAPVLELGGRTWVVSGYAEILELVHSPGVVSDPSAIGIDFGDVFNLADVFAAALPLRAGADHSRLRKLVSVSFGARHVASLGDTIAGIVDELLAPRLAEGSMDVVADLATPLPVAVSCAMLDIPEDERPQVAEWARLISRSMVKADTAPEDAEALEPAIASLRDYVDELCARRAARPGADMISALVAARARGELSDEELFAYVVLLFANGLETLTSGIAVAVWRVLHDPALLASLRSRPETAEAVFNECLRFASPVRAAARVTRADVHAGGRRIPAGSAVFLLLAAANRDPRRFPEPDRFDATRTVPHLAFGHGPHHCLGAALSLLAGGLVLSRVAEHCENLATPLTEATAPWSTSVVFAGLQSLPVTFTPTRAAPATV